MAAPDQLIAILKSPALAHDLPAQPALWTEIRRQADIHRLSAWLAHATHSALPASEHAWRNEILFAHHRRHTLRVAALRRLLEAFHNVGIPCVSLKGPMLAERFYAHPFLRPANDLDILICERDAGKAARLMIQLGFHMDDVLPWAVQRDVVHHLNFGALKNSPRVEVHYALEGGGNLIPGAEFMDRAIPWQSPSGFEARVLSPADEAFFSTIHAANHGFHRLRWLYDSVTIARSLTAEDRARVRELAIRHRQTGRVVAATLAAQELLNEPLQLDTTGFRKPWLWTTLQSRHVRRMVERVEGNTVTLAEKIGFRFDLLRMSGTPWTALAQTAAGISAETRKAIHNRRNAGKPETLIRTLPGYLEATGKAKAT